MFPNRRAHDGQFEPDLLQSVTVVLAGTFDFSARFWKSLAPLARAKESLHNCFSAQGLIISRAF